MKREYAGELEKLVIETASARAEIFTQGAHLALWQPRNHQPVLWMSTQSTLSRGHAIRGGVPICFPWFGARREHPDSPSHGFARLNEWELVSNEQAQSEEETVLQWRLSALPAQDGHPTLSQWPHHFEARYMISIGRELSLQLEVENTGESSFEFEAALHTYFAVSDAREIEIDGLRDTKYFDKVAAKECAGETEPIRITGETDRVYQNTVSTCVLRDTNWKRRIAIEKSGSQTTVVWNPWSEKARALPDFGDDEWPHMVCIETANVGVNAITLAPRQKYMMTARIGVEND